jgi:TonB family protein
MVKIFCFNQKKCLTLPKKLDFNCLNINNKKIVYFMKKLVFLFVLIMLSYSAVIFAQEPENQDSTANNKASFGYGQVVPPKFPTGEAAMYRFLDSVLVVPQSAIDNNESGRVIIRFFVDTEGNIKAPSVQQGLTPDCNMAALEAIKQMPKWIPAKQNNRNVTGFASVPVSFKTKQVTYDYIPSQEELDYEPYVLEEKKWILEEINGEPVPDNVPEVPYFILTKDKKNKKIVEGNASCADFTAKYQWTQKRFRLSFNTKKMEMKKKKCKSKKVKVIDGDFIEVLKDTKEYRIKGSKLLLGKIERDRFVPMATFRYEIIAQKKKK